MNTPTHITLSYPQVNNQTSDSGRSALQALPPEVLTAKNIQFSKDSVTLDVFMNKHWQTIRLGVSNAPTNADKIASANIQLSLDGKSLTIIPNNNTITIKQPAQLQRFLNFINTSSDIQSSPVSLQVVLQPSPKLFIEKFNASIAINKQVAQLLADEPSLKGMIITDTKGSRINVINRFADVVHSQPINQSKLTQLLASNLSNATLQAMPKFALLSPSSTTSSLTINLSHRQLSELPTSPTQVNITSQADKLLIKTAYQNIAVSLNNSFSKPFNEMVSSQQAQTQINSLANKVHPLSSINSPIQSWLKSSFGDLKTRIADAIKHFENKPFSAPLNSQQKPASVSAQAQEWLVPTQKINITQTKTETSITPPLIQFTQRIKSSVSLWQQSPSAISTLLSTSSVLEAKKLPNKELTPNKLQHLVTQVAQEQTSKEAIKQNLQPLLTQRVQGLTRKDVVKNNIQSLATHAAQTLKIEQTAEHNLKPLEKQLFATILQQNKNQHAQQKNNMANLASAQINNVTAKTTDQAPDLKRLVNQAFNRMLSDSNLHPTAIQREILSTIRPTHLTSDTLQSSFNRGIEQLSLSILAAPIINQNPSIVSINNQTGLEALLQVLLPTFKVGNTANKLLEQLQQPQVQALAGELTQVKNTLSQVQAPAISQQPDTNALVQFLLPMKLPPEAAQTEITLGQYKKPSSDKLADKSVWFVRLNFDYAELGKLQITAELMDKALDCQLLASTQAVSALAHPHLDNLRAKLAKQGLQVGELKLKRADDSHQSFYQSHAIINIKV